MTEQEINVIMPAAAAIFVQLVAQQGHRLRTVDLEQIYASLRTAAITQAALIYSEVVSTEIPVP
jgi:2-keto-3-deoxy-galactonokinase